MGINVSTLSTARATPGREAIELGEVPRALESSKTSFERATGLRNLAPPQVSTADAHAIAAGVLEMLDTAMKLDEILEQTQELTGPIHDPLIQQGAQALSSGISTYLRDGETGMRGALPANSPAEELNEIFFDALCEVEDDFFDARSSFSVESGSDDVYYDARTGNETTVAIRLRNVLAAFEQIARNEFESPHARRLSNVANMALQSVVATGIPTFVRQAVAFGIEQSLTSGNASLAARTALGAVAGSLPLLLGAAGLVHDNVRGVATTTSNLSRGTGLLIGGSVMTAAGMTGSLATLAPTLAAYNLVHAVMSEAIQAWIRLQSNSNPVNAQAAAMITASSVVNTMVANQLTSHGAPTSGQGPAAAGQGWQPLTDLTRGAINAAASTAGGFLSHVWRHCSSTPDARQGLRLSLEAALPQRQDLVQQLFGSYALEASAGTNTYLMDDMLALFIQSTGLSEIQIIAVRDALAAVVGGAQYPLIMGAMSHRELPPPASDPEAGRGSL
ncbi:hypothetical protein [Pseudomonas sp. IPO3774]|uniref:hypothetical protein n=1 Tax=Pseudomonas sp. IPO3774 TaxID=2738826 RepID=UPI00159FE735|nr:hypothetical protein [Pseudomonas sp. IPO3774]NWD64123.1 hypothetical protein [Pseudomonas sp. IPO3774]